MQQVTAVVAQGSCLLHLYPGRDEFGISMLGEPDGVGVRRGIPFSVDVVNEPAEAVDLGSNDLVVELLEAVVEVTVVAHGRSFVRDEADSGARH